MQQRRAALCGVVAAAIVAGLAGTAAAATVYPLYGTGLEPARSGIVAADSAFSSLSSALAVARRIRYVEPGGAIRTVAGTGAPGGAGDGGPATAASLTFPEDVVALPGVGFAVLDGNGGPRARIRVVDPAGSIRTLTETDASGLSLASDGGLLLIDYDEEHGRIRHVSLDRTLATARTGAGSHAAARRSRAAPPRSASPAGCPPASTTCASTPEHPTRSRSRPPRSSSGGCRFRLRGARAPARRRAITTTAAPRPGPSARRR